MLLRFGGGLGGDKRAASQAGAPLHGARLLLRRGALLPPAEAGEILRGGLAVLGRGDDAAGNPRRAQRSQFELFELILLSKLDKQFPAEQFEATVSQSTVMIKLLKL